MSRRQPLAAVAFLILIPGTLFAQSGIAGVVKDTSGGVLPGVTVEAASPVLIEKVRTVVTDGGGNYQILDLRPGVYSVTFSLTGFRTVKRDGIELPAAFTATVGVELAVSTLEETITVSGAAPLVDVRNVTSQRVLRQEMLDALPAARSPQGFTALTPGIISQGLGGIPGGRREMNTQGHGSATGDSFYAIDGLSMSSAQGISSNPRIPQAYVSEINIVTGGGTAEQQLGGTMTNVIPKEGGNTFAGNVYVTYSTAGLTQDNLTPALSAMGFSGNGLSNLRKLWDVQPALGGRILRDKLWFFASYRNSGTIMTRAGVFDNLTPRGWNYTPDLNRPALNKLTTGSKNLRLTWQVSAKNKLSLFSDFEPMDTYNYSFENPISPEANPYAKYRPNAYSTAKWSAPLTNRWLIEAGAINQAVDNNSRRQTPETCECSAPVVGFDVISALDTTTGMVFRADSANGGENYRHAIRHTLRSTVSSSYITGSHAIKAGFQYAFGRELMDESVNGSLAFSLRSGVPISLVEFAMPLVYDSLIREDSGMFVQDQWTHKRLTLTGGVRYDRFNGGAAAQHLDAGLYVPARDYPETTHSPLWKDVSPRASAAFDLFGDGKTAIKTSVGRFVKGVGASTALTGVHPVLRSVRSVNRSWGDEDFDFWPDCDLKSPVANGECGPMNNVNFGQNNPSAIQYAPELLTGLRPYNWETTLVVERQLMTGISATVGYYHKVFKGFTISDNLLATPADYDEYCITAPTNSRLPGGGGNRICGLYDITPTLFGRGDALVKPVDNYSTGYDGIDILQSMRLDNGITISGGVNIQRTTSNTCVVVDSPQALRFCDTNSPFKSNATYVGFVPLPWWGLLTSATYRDYPGSEITATYQVRNADIAPSLGRNLASGVNGTVNVELIAPKTVYGPRQRQLDFRLSKRFRFGSQRLMANLDIFNLANVNSPETTILTYGPNWLRPIQLQQGRYIKLSGQFDF